LRYYQRTIRHMNDAPLVSVIVPAYNAESVLTDALTSVRSQIFENYEVIVVDDGSTDNTFQIAEKWAEQDSRFKVVRHESNMGLPSARNTAIRHAGGELIAFLDADDVWLPAKIERQVELFRKDAKANIVFTNYWSWDGKCNSEKRYSLFRKFPQGNVSAQLIRANLFGISSVVVKRQTLEVAGLFDPQLLAAEDWDLWLRIAEHGLWARGVWESQLRYRIWAGNMSANKIKIASYVVRVLEKAAGRKQTPERMRQYRRALQIARGNLELAKGRPLIETQPGAVPAAVLRAWLCCPTRLKWLLWYFATLLPNSPWGKIVCRKIKGKW